VIRIDVHQHIWTTPLLDRLALRVRSPFVRREEDITVLQCAGEQPYLIDVAAEAPSRRAALVAADGVDLAVIALSSPIGIEALAREESQELIDAHLDGVHSLGPRFAAWGPVALDRAEPNDVDCLLGRGCVGVSVAAGALAGPGRHESIGPVLERIAERSVPLFVHPGPAPGDRSPSVTLSDPLWWQALTDYVAQMHAAWLTFMAFGRREHPELSVVFAMLAGGAPLQSERLATRGGPAIELRDPAVFYDSSSYGPAAIEMLARTVGERQLVLGSDRPVIVPVPSGYEAVLGSNAADLLVRGPGHGLPRPRRLRRRDRGHPRPHPGGPAAPLRRPAHPRDRCRGAALSSGHGDPPRSSRRHRSRGHDSRVLAAATPHGGLHGHARRNA
jgi:6-methylsalicylate decarboxylase